MLSTKRRVRLAAVVAASLLLAGLTACSGGASDSGKTVLTFWTRGAGSEELVKRYNASQDKVEVQVSRVPGDQYVTKIGSAAKSGDVPDILDLDDIQGPLFASNNILLDISDKVKALPYADSLNEAQMGLATYNDKIFAVPNIAGPSVLMYNKGLFTQAGIDPSKAPSNWAEIEDAAKKVTALGNGTYGFDIPGGCAGCIAYVFYPLVWASGGEVLSDDFGAKQTTSYADSPQVAEAFSFVQKLWQEGVVNPAGQTQDGSTWGEDFAAGKLGIFLGTPEAYPAAVKAGIDVGVAPIPGKDGGTSTFVGGDLLGITAASTHHDESWDFIQWMLDKPQQEYIAELALVPTRLDMLTDDFAAKYPAPAAGLEAMKEGRVPKSLAWNAIAGSTTAPFVVAYQSIIFGGDDPATVLPKTDADSLDLIKQAAQNAGQ
jgi:multiple sugar transport system substrate-binding protein